MKKIAILVATFFGAGHLPVAPGTWASLLTALIVFFTPLSTLPFVFLALITAFVYAIGIPAAGICEKYYQKHDPRQCVIDEVAGQLVSLWFLPRQAGFYIAAFLLFRILDILKPYPINKSEALPRGIGIMTDDVLAGFYTLAILQAIRYFFFN
ncbi:MAG TPA: phosphatidylglycerophosphatase A [Patescibacteria group bacterium]|nr:phosphatidylglycerophosphatase A [Patescibacteria group bacterium]